MYRCDGDGKTNEKNGKFYKFEDVQKTISRQNDTIVQLATEVADLEYLRDHKEIKISDLTLFKIYDKLKSLFIGSNSTRD